MMNHKFVPWVLGGLVLLVAPLLIYPVLLMKILCFALFACAFNLLLGFAGLLSFGHAAFFGGAAFLCGHALKVWELSPLFGILVATSGAAGLGLVMGLLAIRRQGIYFAMVTLALAQMLFFFFLQSPWTGGEEGLQGVPRGHMLGVDLANDLSMYYVVAVIFALAFALVYRTVNSPYGQILKAIRENEPRAVSLGYDVNRYKLLAFVLSAALAGLAGAVKTLVFKFATLTDAHWHTSGEVILMTLVGGMGTLLGPVVGAGVIVALQNELADKVGPLVKVIMGLIFIVCVLVLRRGLVGEIQAILRNMRSK